MQTFQDIPAVCLETPAGARAWVSLHGAQLLSWMPACGRERLYLSERADMRPGAAIRGGVPVIFPQFGRQGPLAVSHGFARRRDWLLVSTRQQDDFAAATLRLEDDAASRELWPHAFEAELTVMIEGNRLDIELEVANTDAAAIDFTAALHTYLRLGNVELARLQGLEGLDYIDQTKAGKRDHDDRYAVLIDDEIDRIYLNANRPLLLSGTGQQLAIEQSGFSEVVVWNPWQARAAALADMAPLDFKRMLCVEAAITQHPVHLMPGEDWCGRQTLIAV